MIIHDQQLKDVEETMQSIERGVRRDAKKTSEIVRLENEIRAMSRDAKSVERSGDTSRIQRFNKMYIDKLGRLSRLRQTSGSSKREDIAFLISQNT